MLAMLGCIVAAIIFWKRHPRVSLTVIIGMALMLIHVFVFAITYAVLPNMLRQSTGSYARLQTVYNVISFFSQSSLAVALGILLVAVFMQRNKTVQSAAP